MVTALFLLCNRMIIKEYFIMRKIALILYASLNPGGFFGVLRRNVC